VWKPLTVWGAVVLALGLVTGFFPGGSTRARVDHCYVSSGYWTPGESKCTGHWSTAGFTVTGRVYGIDVPTGDGDGWQASGPKLPGDWYEVKVPDSVRERSVVAVPGAAVVLPGVVWLVRLMLFLVVPIAVIALASRARNLWLLRAYERELRNRHISANSRTSNDAAGFA
jgi:hypothetical protein